MYNLLCKIWQFFASIKDSIIYKGCDFGTWMVPKELVGHEDKGNKYQPSTDSLKRVLKRFTITKNDRILDIGCGKGKAMYLMSKFSFGEIYGYDISKELVDIANQNIKKLKIDNCKAIVSDAYTYKDYDRFNYFYLCNSFPEKVFSKVIKNIEKSVKNNPRKVILIYMNPVCDNYLKKSSSFKEIYRYKSIIKWFEYRCYECEGENI